MAVKRDILVIDDDLCNGCGLCVPECHEGALQIIDDKVRLVSELMCDGLGNCIGHCPEGAITIEKKEAAPYDEVLVIKEMIPKGKNLIIAHLSHLADHRQEKFLNHAFEYLDSVKDSLSFDVEEIKALVYKSVSGQQASGGCPGSDVQDFAEGTGPSETQVSALSQWPIQLHLVSPMAPYFQKADLLIAADCVPFALPNFHRDYLAGRSVGIGCPKLDNDQEIYLEKIKSLIDDAKVNTITVMIMQVPCCQGLLQTVQGAAQQASRKVPVKQIVVGIQGEVISEDWC